MRRYILTGAPGAGKTAILEALRCRGHAVVDEAATDVVNSALATRGVHPNPDGRFLDAIVRLQREREQVPTPPGVTVQLYDRSPICTLALSRFVGLEVTPELASEVDRIVGEQIYQPRVFFVHLLGFVTPTPARRISFAQTQRFEEFHVEAYRSHGYELVDVPAGTIDGRAALIERSIRSMSAPGAAAAVE
jgi:predicted ATPase